MEKSTTRKILYVLFIVLCIELVVQGIISFNRNPDLTYFTFAGLIAVVTLAVTLGVEKISNDKLERKIDKIMEKMGIECPDESPQKNKDKPISTEVMERKCWFKAKGNLDKD